jgi:hypothetical protein
MMGKLDNYWGKLTCRESYCNRHLEISCILIGLGRQVVLDNMIMDIMKIKEFQTGLNADGYKKKYGIFKLL